MMDQALVFILWFVIVALVVTIVFLLKWWYSEKDTKKDSTNSDWLDEESVTKVNLKLMDDSIRAQINEVLAEVRNYHPEIPASDPGEEEIKKLCEAFISRLKEHVDYWNQQSSSTPKP